MPTVDVAASKLLGEIRVAREESDRLFSILKPDALYSRPITERHRVIFYLGHLDGFDAIQICREGVGLKSPDSSLDNLFQAGIDPDADHLPSDTPSDWPSVAAVRDYAMRCRERVDECIERAPEDVVHMAIEHRQMHLETLAYMFHNFGYELKNGSSFRQPRLESRPDWNNEWRDIPAGEAVLGKPRDGVFGWDNEYDETRRAVAAFRIQKYDVTNGEYLRFVRDGAPLPFFWSQRGDSIFYRGMFRDIPFPLDWPVFVTQAEAENYAAWLGKKLPSEEQFHRAAYGACSGNERPYPWGDGLPTRRHGNFDFKGWDPEPVHATPAGDSGFGVSQLLGNGWEWTSTIFAPLPGFQARPSYPGYSANFFDGEHYVMKGGSARTAARLLRNSFRNWFRRDYPYTYATFRCVEN